MAVNERSFSEVITSIFGNVQEIIRSEVRLAKTEIREEAVNAKPAALFLVAGGLAAFFATLFLLWTVVNLLTLVVPAWAATLIVGGILAATAGVVLSAGIAKFKQIHPTPERTVEGLKENLEWAKQQTK